MKALKDVDALLVTYPTNIRYLTGFVGVDQRDAYLLIMKSKTYLFTNSLYLEQARKLEGFVIKEISRENPISKELGRLAGKLKIKKLGFEEANLTVSEYNKLKNELSKVLPVPTKNRIEEMRMIKRNDEIKWIREASKLTDQCFDFILGKLRPGVAETEIAWEIETFFRKNGAGTAFSPIVAFNKNFSQPHYAPSKTYTLKANSLVLLDFGARVNGYCADMTRVVFIGTPKDEWKRAYRAVLGAQIAALMYLDKIRSPRGARADRIARTTIKKAEFPPYPHSLGHNVGLDIHEAPRLTVKKDAKLLPGMVFSVEPAIYKEAQYGIRIEDLVLLKKDCIENLSHTTKEEIIL